MHKENEGYVDSYILGNGISICFNQIYRSSWTKGDSSVFSDEMLILNFCRSGRCDVSLAQNRYAIVKERQVCVSTILPNKDFYYPGRLYEGVQIYIDRRKVREADEADFLTMMGIRTEQLVELFQDFYADFDSAKAHEMLARLELDPKAPLKTLSKGNKEKVQLILAMSRNARLYLLDEPIGGVDPAARDYILHTILSNYSENAAVVISTHLIEDIEPALDEAIFLKEGRIFAHRTVDEIRETEGKSVDEYFREVFKC